MYSNISNEKVAPTPATTTPVRRGPISLDDEAFQKFKIA